MINFDAFKGTVFDNEGNYEVTICRRKGVTEVHTYIDITLARLIELIEYNKKTHIGIVVYDLVCSTITYVWTKECGEVINMIG